jgi:hypothetical protein
LLGYPESTYHVGLRGEWKAFWIALVAIAAALIAGVVFDYFPPSEMMFVGP